MKLFVVLTFFLLAACGRSNTIYNDNVDGVVGTDGRSLLPTGFADQSVNNGFADVALAQARLRLTGGTSTAGSFNDSTLTGNRALLGITKYDQTMLSTFALAITDSSSTSSELHVSLLIDLNCDKTIVRTVESSAVALGTASLSVGDSVWSAPGGAIQDANGAEVLNGTTSSSLSSLLTAYPQACLRNARSDAPDAPSAIPVGSVLLSIGGGSSTSVEELDIQSLTINGDIYQTWGQK